MSIYSLRSTDVLVINFVILLIKKKINQCLISFYLGVEMNILILQNSKCTKRYINTGEDSGVGHKINR